MNKQVFDLFDAIRQIPRPSKHEERISQWLVDFAAAHAIECVRDEAMNVIMRVPASAGYEDKPGIILQAHMDMVCEKDGHVQHDFMTDPIETYIDGEWLRAKGTTLGGDDGIGVAMALAVLTDKSLPHPALEALFTVDEETGLTGAFRLQDGLLNGQRLINLDSEDDGQIFIGCAGGIDTLARMGYEPLKIEDLRLQNLFALRVAVSGLTGGHSGDDINKGRANANKVIVNYLQQLQDLGYELSAINGGNLRNAIAREAEAVIIVPNEVKHETIVRFNTYKAEVEEAYKDTEPTMQLTIESTDMPATILPHEQAYRLIDALCECPHGVIAMSEDMPGLVQTSTNLASVKMRSDEQGLYIEVNTSQRSSVEAEKHAVKDRVEQVLATACDRVTHGDGYPGWAPNVHSPILDIARKAYENLFGDEPKVLAIHAGLECGLFLEKYPYLDMISIGPQMYGVHSPQERLSIPSTDRTYEWLKRILANA